jgi:hypothetical protein
MPDQNGFLLLNTGDAPAYNVEVESFTIGPSVEARSKAITFVLEKATGFALVWVDSAGRRGWDLRDEMAAACEKKQGRPMYAPNYDVAVSIKYEDAEGSRYRTKAKLSFIPSTGTLEFGGLSFERLSGSAYATEIRAAGSRTRSTQSASTLRARDSVGMLDLDQRSPPAPVTASPAPQLSQTVAKRGRPPNKKRRDAVRSAISRHGEEWRDHLGEIFKELDSKDVAMGRLQNRKIDLDDADNIIPSKWEDLDFAEGKQRSQIIDALRKYAD